jgi:murein DD-endopeptidase MepM/ murein hydrolase activator NlpD
MLINKYNLTKAKNLSKSNMNYLIRNLSQNQSFTELSGYYKAILADIKCYPVNPDKMGKLNIAFTDTWNEYRSYGGNRRHEGTDLMSAENIRGDYPVVSMTDGTVEKKGWLEKGGYRIGIRGTYGAYFYYAHLESYAPELNVGDTVKAGQLLGYMGDSGYGREGTVGKFDVHLHVGIYVETAFGELSVNPYLILRYLENQNETGG